MEDSIRRARVAGAATKVINAGVLGPVVIGLWVGLLAGCEGPGIVESIDTAGQENLLPLPATLRFYPFRCQGGFAFDAVGDRPGAARERDVVGDASAIDQAAAYYASEGDTLYLRMRLDRDPGDGGDDLDSFGWGYLIDTEDRATPGVPEYERLIHINGTGGADSLKIFENITIEEDLSNDPADEPELRDYTDDGGPGTGIVDRWVVTTACTGAGNGCFNDDDDLFLTYAVDWGDLQVRTASTAGLFKGQSSLVWAGTTSSNASLDRDFMCDSAGGTPLLSVLAPDPVILTCGNDALEDESSGDDEADRGEGCDDGDLDDGDGCNSRCLIEDGFACNADPAGVLGDRSCASGVCAGGVCSGIACGNDQLEAGEGCDDGAAVNGDGCDASCRVETGSACNEQAPGLTGDGSCVSGICDTTGGAPGVCVDFVAEELVVAGGACGAGRGPGDAVTAGGLVALYLVFFWLAALTRRRSSYSSSPDRSRDR